MSKESAKSCRRLEEQRVVWPLRISGAASCKREGVVLFRGVRRYLQERRCFSDERWSFCWVVFGQRELGRRTGKQSREIPEEASWREDAGSFEGKSLS